MEKILWPLIILTTITSITASIYSDERETSYEKEAFWPPDLIPHPHVPGSGPKEPSQGDLA